MPVTRKPEPAGRDRLASSSQRTKRGFLASEYTFPCAALELLTPSREAVHVTSSQTYCIRKDSLFQHKGSDRLSPALPLRLRGRGHQPRSWFP